MADFIRFSGVTTGMGVEDLREPDHLDALTDRTPMGTICAGEAWADMVLAELAVLPDGPRTAWNDFLRYTLTATATTPSKAWLRRAEIHIAALSWPAVEARLVSWFESATRAHHYPPHAQNVAILRGLVWCCTLQESEELVRAIGYLAEAMFKKIPGIGARSARVGNSCLYALSLTPGRGSVAQMERLRLRVKGQSAQAAVQKALAAAAEREGITRDALEELVVPTFGLDGQGHMHEAVGESVAEIAISGTQQIDWRWRTAGIVQASVPARVKQHHAEELKTLKRTVDDMRQALGAQRARLESLFLLDRSWTLAVWRERYLDHPLLREMCCRLIWYFDAGGRTTPGIWHQGLLVDVAGHPIDWLAEGTTVRLWHPLGSDPAVVLRWRLWLEEHQVAQPFKQAHREVYLLTDAELCTETYSNRFAAHLLRQDTFYALCQERGWRYRAQGGFNSGDAGVARRALLAGGMHAEFWVAAEGGPDEPLGGAGLYLTIPTDQVRFAGPDGAPRPLPDIPTIVFSETMREIDLFVSVCSVGNDPAWQDRGDIGTGDAPYWQRYAFGELLATATTRRELLARLLPSLRIAERCSLEGRFLIVRGDLRAYKIHLGSGNILMGPNDQYLCIVPDRRSTRGAPARVFLPFEGDTTLSLILSKAFMLADDTAITDQSIVRQIRG